MLAFLGAHPGWLAGLGGLLLGWLGARAVWRPRLDHQRGQSDAAIAAARQEVEHLARAQVAGEALRGRLEEELQAREGQLESLRAALARSQARGARLETIIRQDRLGFREKAAFVAEARGRLVETYQALSAEALRANNQAFLDLAQTALSRFVETARGDMTQRSQAVDEMIRPLRDALERYERGVQSMERVREKSYGELTQQLRQVAATQQTLQLETGRLVQALRAPQVRGRWGEVTLQRVVELAGMTEHCDFHQQPVSGDGDGDGGLRPDMIVQLPGGRQVVVDAKCPLAAYLEAVEAETPEARERLLDRHAGQVLTHIQQLARKSYWARFQPTPEFVVLFIPGESFLAAALSRNPALIEVATARNVIPATPTTLIALLKAVAFGWRQQCVTESALAISDLGQELYERLAVLTQHLANLGRDLDRSVASYNQTVGSFERRVLTSARKFGDLGLKLRHLDELPGVPPVERSARLVSPEGPHEN
jgi:DNA recombination protein RmuC